MHFNVKDISGKRFGKLLVTDFSHIGKGGSVCWKCKCDCGTEHITAGYALRRGTVKSCGCIDKGRPRHPDRIETILRAQYSSKIRKSVKRRGIPNNLSFDDWKEIVLRACYYCGIPYSLTFLDDHHHVGTILSDTIVYCNGVDRIDSERGYSKENCVSCCTFCNFAKNNLSQQDFYKSIKRLHEHLQITGQFKKLKE
jgi:hypothetical protein